ncbi:hypothetical protein BHYA_0993g00010 [Botrytis hyacinthi]|uniref:Uncharacterized protein n=1 Tax=Botrytis hyacinthi TaxID=278943 RepID=A0A4Z1GB37_9HELO|nr:hypothetical protein BHYA_0993g00010 [Botrytis hyacinthi]
MKLISQHLLALLAAFTTSALADPCSYYGPNAIGPTTGVTVFRFYNDNPGHWSWNAQSGDATIQDDGWMYFDGDGVNQGTSAIAVVYNNGDKYLYQPPSGSNGCLEGRMLIEHPSESLIGYIGSLVLNNVSMGYLYSSTAVKY